MTNPLPSLPDEILIDLLDGESLERLIEAHPEYVSEIRTYVSLIGDLRSTYAGVRPSPESLRSALALTRGIDAMHARPRRLWHLFAPLGAVALLALFFTFRTPVSRDTPDPSLAMPASSSLEAESLSNTSPTPSLKQAGPDSSARMVTGGAGASLFAAPPSDPNTELFMTDASSEEALLSDTSTLDTAGMDVESLETFNTLYTDGEF